MKKLSLSLLLLILSFYLIADGLDQAIDSQLAEKQVKEQQLEQLSNRFKTEAGFRGEISYDYSRMKLQSYEGKFSGISYSAEADTSSFRQACDYLLDKILPYSFAKRNQLSKIRVKRQGNDTSTDYYQQVNGHQVEGLGFIVITYDAGRNRFDIGDNTVELPKEPLGKILTEAEAYQIALDLYKKTELFDEKAPVRSKKFIAYKSREVNGKSQPYRLCWRVTFPYISYYIDAISKETFSEKPIVLDQYTATIKGSKKSTTSGFSNVGDVSMKGVKVLNPDPSYTDLNGEVPLVSAPLQPGYQVVLENYDSRVSVSSYNCSGILFDSRFTQRDSLNFETIIGDYLAVDSLHTSYCAPNIFHQMTEQDTLFTRLVNGFDQIGYPEAVNDNTSLGVDELGNFDGTYINLRNGFNTHVIRHEQSHYFTYNTMGNYQFFQIPNQADPDKYQGMDEAFAEYWLSVGIGSTVHDYGMSRNILNFKVADVQASLNNTYALPLNEDFYHFYWCRDPLASSWWSLRNNSLFPSNGLKNGVDTLLIGGISKVRSEISINSSYRYKPRYFYNILMNRVEDDNNSWPLNNKQTAIDNAYSDRGLYFTPKVISTNSLNSTAEKDTFKIGDSVYYTLSNCPQNTPLTLYIVKDRDYTDGMTVGSINPIVTTISISAAEIGDFGTFSGVIPNSSTLEAGGYDIVADIGSDGFLNFAYSAANIHDGFDGLNDTGFTVEDDDDDEDPDEPGSNETVFDSDFLYKDIDLTAAGGTFHGEWVNNFAGVASNDNADYYVPEDYPLEYSVKINFEQYLYDCIDGPTTEIEMEHGCRGPRNKNLVYQVFCGSYVEPGLEVFKGYFYTDALVNEHWTEAPPVTFYIPKLDSLYPNYQDYKKCWLFFVRTQFPENYTAEEVHAALNEDVDYYITHMQSVGAGPGDITYAHSTVPFYDITVDDISFDWNLFNYRLLYGDRNEHVIGAEPIALEDLSVIYKNIGGLRARGSNKVIITYKINGDSISTPGFEDAYYESTDPDSESVCPNIGRLGFPLNAEITGGVIRGTLRIQIISKWSFVKERDEHGDPEYVYCDIYGENLSNNDRTFNIEWTLPSWQASTPNVNVVGTNFFDAINSELPRPNPHNYIYMKANTVNNGVLRIHNSADVPILNVTFDFTFEKRNLKRETNSDEWLPLQNGDQNHISYTDHIYRINRYETVEIDVSMIKYRYLSDINYYKRQADSDPSEWRLQCKISFSWICDEKGTIKKAPYDPSQHYLEAKMIFLEDEKLTNYGYPRAYVDAMQGNFYNIDCGDAILSHTMGEWRPPENGLPVHLNAGVDFPSDSPTNEKKTYLVSRGYVEYDSTMSAVNAYCEEGNGEFVYQGIKDFNIGQDVYLYSIIKNSYRNSGVPIGKTMLTNDCELHFEDRSVDGNPINPLRSDGLGNITGINMVDYKPPVIDNVKIMRQNNQYYNNPIIGLNDNSNNVIDANEYPQMDILVNCYDYMTSDDESNNRRKAPYSISYRLTNLDNGNVVKSNTCVFSSVHDKNVLRLYSSDSNENSFEYVLSNNYQNTGSVSGMDGCINTAALLNGSYRLFIEVKDNIPLKDTLSYIITIQNGATALPDEISEDTTISGLYRLTSNVSIVNGAVLTICPGTNIYIETGGTIFVENGILNATGTKENKILFTPIDTDSYWGGIRCLNDSTTVILKYAELQNAMNSPVYNSLGYIIASSKKGGALYLANPDYALIENCEFTNCKSEYGGAVCIGNNNASFLNNKFFSNVATNGGAIYVDSCSVNIIGNYFADSRADDGSAVYFNYSNNPMFINNTVVNNPSAVNRGALFLNDSHVNVSNNILWNNGTEPNPIQVYIVSVPNDDKNAMFRNCDIQKETNGIYGSTNTYSWEDSFALEPKLVANSEFGYILSEDSPCINAGIADTTSLALPAMDIVGNPRIDINSSRIDIGAYEYPGNQPYVIWTDDITTDTIWSADIVYVANTIAVRDSAVLIINPGVHVIFQNSSTLNVYGTLKTMGTIDNHVMVTPDDSTCTWGRIVLSGSATMDRNLKSQTLPTAKEKTLLPNDDKYSRFSEFQFTEFTGNPEYGQPDSLFGIVIELRDNYDVIFNNCKFFSNHRAKGGAISAYNSYPQFDYCTFEECFAEEGGAIYSDYSYPVFKNCSFKNNCAVNGGAIYNRYSYPSIQSSVMTGNQASQGGGAIYNVCSYSKLINNTLVENSAIQGGAIYAAGGSSINSINNIIFSNIANEGAQLFLNTEGLDDEGMIAGLDFSYCDIEGGTDGFCYSDSTNSRGKEFNPGKPSITSNKLLKEKPSDSSTRDNPRVIQIDENFNINAEPYLSEDYSLSYDSPCIDRGCNVGYTSDGVVVNADLLGYLPIGLAYDMGFKELDLQESVSISGTLTHDILLFARNVCITGDLTIPEGVTVTIDSLTTSILVTGNYAINLEGELNINGKLTPKVPIGTSGTATWKGIKITNHGSLVLNNCYLRNVYNSAQGAIMCNDFASLLVRNSEFYNNITNQVNGGAISAGTSPNGTNSRVMISNSSFHNNRAVEGGALYFGNCSKVLVENSKFFYNSALKGGAMVLSDTTIVRNCQIFTNQAQDGGAGIYIENGNNLILNCTISSNCSQSYGGGVYITNVTTTKEHTAIINSIVMGNNCSAATTKDIYGLECDPSGTRYYAYSRIGGFADCKYTSAYAVTDENPLMYFSSEDFQFNLRYYSTCIDGGAPLPFYIYGQDKTLFEEDINRQLSGNFYDIGAIEYIDPPDLEVYTPELKFGQVAIGDTIYQDLRISNRGYLNSLQIESITLPEGFTFVDNASRSNEPGINVPKVKPGKVIDSVSTIRKTSSSKGKNSLTKDATLTSQIDKKTNQNSNKRSISFPLTIDPFETLDLKVQFIPTQSKDYNCIINIVSSGIAEPAAIQISAVGFDDTEHIYDEKVWSDDTLFVSTNIYVHDGAKLTIAPYTTVKYLKNKTITIEGHFVVEDSVRFTTSPGVTNARLFLNKPQRCPIYEYTFHNTSFNNIKLEALSSRGVIEGAHFLNSTLTHEGDYLEINNSAFNFSNVDVFGKGKENDVVRIIRNTFNYTPYNSLISINSYYGFVIAENTLTNYQTALWINESGKGPDHIIAKNTICYNQYGYGIELYHTTADIIDANNINNNYVGIAGLRNSTINIKGSKEEPFQTIHNNYDAELVFAEDSAPVYMDFNLIFDQLYPGQNLLRITNHTGKEFKYNNNYWGPNFNPEVNLNPFGFIHFEPIWDLKPEYLEQYDAVEELYNSASNNYTVGNYLLAFNQFKQVIDIAGEGHDKLVKAAAEQLIGLAVLIEEPYSSLQQYYINEPHLHYKEEFDLLAKYLENCCKIKVGDYEGAINWFESIISNPPSQIDSVYAVIDMAYTYLLMQDDSKYQGFVGKYPQYRYTRYEDFLNMRENLVQDILSKSESHLTPPIITTTLDQNYPNPFNPITTICYSLSKGSKCNLAIYNIKGQKVKELVSTSKSKGKYRVIWDGKDDSGKQVSSGIYFYRLDTKDKVITRKMILMK